jgi:glycine cleavage system H lipoate-binding protein
MKIVSKNTIGITNFNREMISNIFNLKIKAVTKTTNKIENTRYISFSRTKGITQINGKINRVKG